jgi:hypothetical protein
MSYQATRAARARRMSERMQRINENLDRGIKGASKKSTDVKPESKPPDTPAKENPYTRILRRLREDRLQQPVESSDRL